MADVEQAQQMIPFITCEISVCQYVWELMFGINVFDLDLGVQINSIKQPIKSNSVDCLIVGLLPFMIILITVSLSFKIYNKASFREEFTSEEVKSTLSKSLITPEIPSLNLHPRK